MRDSKKYVIYDGATVRAITSSTNATPIVVTSTAHGLSTGDEIVLSGHATNTAANGTWIVTKLTADTFSLDDSVGNGIGGATGAFVEKPTIAHARDFRHAILDFYTTDASIDVSVFGSTQETENSVDFAAASSASNIKSALEIINTADQTDVITGAAEIQHTDTGKQFEINVNGIDWLTCIPTTATGGKLTTITITLYNNQ